MDTEFSHNEQEEKARYGLTRLLAIGQKLTDPENGEFVAKADIVDMMLVCAIAQEPLVIFGEPGTAKSAIISRFCDLLGFGGNDYFEYLLTSFTEPDELLGVVNIKAYMEGDPPRYERIGETGIQHARIIFLDEVFRGNSAILNTLLSIINERVYYEGGQARRANTQVVYGATNTAPTSPDLRAFYARFPIRMLSNRVSQTQPLALLEKGWNLEMKNLHQRSLSENGRESSEINEAICTPSDLEICQSWLFTYWNQPKTWNDPGSGLNLVKKAYFDVVELMNANSEQFKIDDRKSIKLFKMIIARAMLHGSPTSLPTLTDICYVLRHTWEDPELARLGMENVERYISEINQLYTNERKDPVTGDTIASLPSPLGFSPGELSL